jgi:dTDP-4-amino-4,6-dideoxygalactose transaminase
MNNTDKPALLGGTPVRTAPFPEWPVHGEAEREAVEEVVTSGKWWRGAYSSTELGSSEEQQGRSAVERFEEAFASLHKARYAVATATGSGALDIAVKACGVGPGDEVIVPAYTFIASATCILHNNAVPVFVDIDPATYTMAVDKVEEAVSENTKAIIPVHFSGNMVEMDRLLEIAGKYDLEIIEDAAHAHGVELTDGRMAGSIGEIGMFSFQQSKNMTAGEGGIVITSNEELYDLCYSLHHYGREKGRPWYEIHRLGWNYRMTEFQGALLLAQLERLTELNRRRQENAEYLMERLAPIEGVAPITIHEKVKRASFHLFMFRYESSAFEGLHRNRFAEALQAEGIPVATGYDAPVYKNPMFLEQDFLPHHCSAACPVAEKACREEAVWLTQNLFLGTRQDMDSIAEAILKVKRHCRQLYV